MTVFEELSAARAAAEEWCRTTEFDEDVRAIARLAEGARYDGTASYTAEWNGLRFDCTSGAGTNSASVCTAGAPRVILYEASEFGSVIHALRRGPWTNDVMLEAARLLAARLLEIAEEKQRQKEEAQARDELARFHPL